VPDEKTLVMLNYIGAELDLEPKILKKTLKRIGLKEVYLGKVQDNVTHIACFAKWKSSQLEKKKKEIEDKIPKMKVVQTELLTRL
jgi:hypothetical protein